MSSHLNFTTALMIGSTILTAKTTVTIDKAIEKNMIKTEVVCKGGLVVDYKIKVPSLYIQNIAEDVDVKLNAVMGPIKKN